MNSLYLVFLLLIIIFSFFLVMCYSIKKNKNTLGLKNISYIDVFWEKIIIMAKIFGKRNKWVLYIPVIVIFLVIVLFLMFSSFSQEFLQFVIWGLVSVPVLILLFFYLLAQENERDIEDDITTTRVIYSKTKLDYLDYIHTNMQKLNLFLRPYRGEEKLVLANKYIVIELNINEMSSQNCNLIITDKINGGMMTLLLLRKGGKAFTLENNYDTFEYVCGNFNYETQISDIWGYLTQNDIEYYKLENNTKLVKYLDINEASEAEMTTLPGVTIAKAKRAIKIRNKNIQFLTMNQFYKAINLDEKFVEQIKSKGNKVLLKELPMYREIEQKDNNFTYDKSQGEFNILYELPKKESE